MDPRKTIQVRYLLTVLTDMSPNRLAAIEWTPMADNQLNPRDMQVVRHT